jgi:membrane-bound lytic murein transglycosylase A
MMRPWTRRHTFLAALVCIGLLAAALLYGTRPVPDGRPQLLPVTFADIEGWENDDHAEAFRTFHRSCGKIISVHHARVKAGKGDEKADPFIKVCRAALELGAAPGAEAAKAFFEARFSPHRYEGGITSGFVTGYYEPELKGSRARSDAYTVPVYRVPDDLEQFFPDAERAKRNAEMTAGRREGERIVPYYDRREIEQGALEDRGLEILWLADPVDAFYMHIQGSGRVALAEGGHVRLAYAAKNGHEYTAIGKALIERGEIDADNMSMGAVRAWLAANPDKARDLMWRNRSYIFFRELRKDDGEAGPQGAQGVALTPHRSLAVDTSIHQVGIPVWVDVPQLDLHGEPYFRHLMVAQDTGSAIRGPERGDIFWGSGEDAGRIAGATRHDAQFTIFLPNESKPGS